MNLVSMRDARERGQVVVFFALLLPVIFGLGSVVLSVGQWYVHKKHLQTLADAAAFAAVGLEFTRCANGSQYDGEQLDQSSSSAEVQR